VYVLKKLIPPEIRTFLHQALHHPFGFPDLDIQISDELLDMLCQSVDSDARKSLNCLELAIDLSDQ